MTVNEIKPNIICLEYRQEPKDEDYGTCLYARFYFNLDRYELTIISDCDNYGYKWVETKETFLELMARIDGGYLLDKIYGSPNIFDYEKTKKSVYEHYVFDDESKKALDDFFEDLELLGCEPDTAELFATKFMDDYEFGDSEVWYSIVQGYPANALKITQVYEDYIKPKIREMIKG